MTPKLRYSLYATGIAVWAVPMLLAGLGWFEARSAWFGWGVFVLGLGLITAAFARFTPPEEDVVVLAPPARDALPAPGQAVAADRTVVDLEEGRRERVRAG